MVSEIPGPYPEVTSGFSDKSQMQARGMTLLDQATVKVDGQRALLLNVEQLAYGTLFRKWLLAVERPAATVRIVASFPKEELKEGEDLRSAILAVAFGEASDPANALAFTATPVDPFEVPKIMGADHDSVARRPVPDER